MELAGKEPGFAEKGVLCREKGEESGPEKNMEVLGGSLAGRDVAIMMNTEPRLCADTRNVAPLTPFSPHVTLLPFRNKKQRLRHFFQLVKEPGVTPRQPGL